MADQKNKKVNENVKLEKEIDSLNIKIGLSVSDETAAAAAAILGLWFEEHPEKTIISCAQRSTR